MDGLCLSCKPPSITGNYWHIRNALPIACDYFFLFLSHASCSVASRKFIFRRFFSKGIKQSVPEWVIGRFLRFFGKVNCFNTAISSLFISFDHKIFEFTKMRLKTQKLWRFQLTCLQDLKSIWETFCCHFCYGCYIKRMTQNSYSILCLFLRRKRKKSCQIVLVNRLTEHSINWTQNDGNRILELYMYIHIYPLNWVSEKDCKDNKGTDREDGADWLYDVIGEIGSERKSILV